MIDRVGVIPIVNISLNIIAHANVRMPGALGTVTLTTKEMNIVNQIRIDKRRSSSKKNCA